MSDDEQHGEIDRTDFMMNHSQVMDFPTITLSLKNHPKAISSLPISPAWLLSPFLASTTTQTAVGDLLPPVCQSSSSTRMFLTHPTQNPTS